MAFEDVLQDGRRTQHERHDEAVHKAELVRHRRRHVDHVVGTEMQAIGKRHQIRQHRVRGVHHAFRLAGRAAGVEQLDYIIGSELPRAGDGGFFALRRRKQRPECSIAVAADYKDMAQSWKFGPQARRHAGIVETSESCRHDKNLSLGEPQHETEVRARER